MTVSFSHRHYSRFIPSEEVGEVTQWQFGAMDDNGHLLPEAVPEQAPEPDPEAQEAARQALMQQALEEAHAQGHAKGFEEATAQWQQRMDDYVSGQGREAAVRLADVAQALHTRLSEVEQHMAGELLQLACDIAREVVRKELSVNPKAVEPVVQEALGLLMAEGRSVTVRMHPADLAVVENSLREEFSNAEVRWVADAAVEAGGCMVESAAAFVDGSLGKRWQRAIATLGLESPWQEPQHGA